jgi:predicted  nucleic acid-binding Zn-ribbon protein
MQIEERVAKIEGIVEQMNERLNHIETDLGDLREEMKSEIRDLRSDLGTLREETRSEIRDLRSDLTHKIESNFKWTIGLMLTMWVTIILTILFHA